MKSYEDRVRDGIELLNEVMPDWYAKIDLETFSFSDRHLCVIGQLFPYDPQERSYQSFIKSVWELGIVNSRGEEYGFDLYNREPDGSYAVIDHLDRIWKREIKKLQESVK